MSSPVTPASRTAVAAAEGAGTFLLVFGLIGTALFSAGAAPDGSPPSPIGPLLVALSLGFTVIIGAYAFGPISGGHFNPAVSLGMAIAGRLRWRELPVYVLAQLVGGILGAGVIAGIAAGAPDGFLSQALASGFASNGYDGQSPNGFSLLSALAVEIVGSAVFVTVVLRVSRNASLAAVAPVPIGLTLSLLLFVAIPVDNAGFNPARSIATAVFGGGEWLAQLWLFVLAPAVGALIAGAIDRTTRPSSVRASR